MIMRKDMSLLSEYFSHLLAEKCLTHHDAVLEVDNPVIPTDGFLWRSRKRSCTQIGAASPTKTCCSNNDENEDQMPPLTSSSMDSCGLKLGAPNRWDAMPLSPKHTRRSLPPSITLRDCVRVVPAYGAHHKHRSYRSMTKSVLQAIDKSSQPVRQPARRKSFDGTASILECALSELDLEPETGLRELTTEDLQDSFSTV